MVEGYNRTSVASLLTLWDVPKWLFVLIKCKHNYLKYHVFPFMLDSDSRFS